MEELLKALMSWVTIYKSSPDLQLIGNALAGMVGGVITFLGLWKKLRHEKKEEDRWEAERFFYLHKYLSKPEFVQARRIIRKEKAKKPLDGDPNTWDERIRDAADAVCASYDQAGQILLGGLISEKHKEAFLKSSWGESIRHQYDALQHFMEREDAERKAAFGQAGKFFQRFSDLSKEASKHHSSVSVRSAKP